MAHTHNDKQNTVGFYPMTLDELRSTLTEYSEMEIYYKDIKYSLTVRNLSKDRHLDRITWYRSTEPSRVVFTEEGDYDDLNYRGDLVERMLNAPIFDDGKSFTQAIAEVSVDWFD